MRHAPFRSLPHTSNDTTQPGPAHIAARAHGQVRTARRRCLGALVATIVLLAATIVPASAQADELDCQTDADCLWMNTDDDLCTTAACVWWLGSPPPSPGHCIELGQQIVCPQDNDPCTEEAVCGRFTGCVFPHAANGTACSDGYFCNGSDTCWAGECTAHAGDPCAARVGDADDDCSESCDEWTDSCTANDYYGSACASDGQPCTKDICFGQGTCAHSAPAPAGTPCRAGSGDMCDPDETCTGNSISCPADTVRAAGSLCGFGSGDVCDPDETCTGIAGQACPANTVTPAGTNCRFGAGPCDPAEACTGVAGASCPPNVFAAAGTTCRAGSGDMCDPAETCTGNSISCPFNTVRAAGTTCRAGSGDVCDPAETCTGVAAQACPANVLTAANTPCRVGSGDVCDPTEVCSGSAGQACPADTVTAPGTTCRAASGDACDSAETCSGVALAACPSNTVAAAGTICRAGSGDACDPTETCNGTSGSCPSNVIAAAGTTCRVGSGDECDPTETCTGQISTPCPANVVTAAGSVCRAQVDVTCDVAETCSGSPGQACPADAAAPAATPCRPAANDCDQTETCGGAPTCPADQLKPDTDADTVCDEIDNCELVANLDQADSDGDTVGTACDNCPLTCNPDQDNADGDARGGDVCDVCPAIDESTQAPECDSATYNSALACCRDSASEGISVDADGPSCGAAGDVTFQTWPDPTTGTTVTVEIPSGAVDGPTSISVTPMTKGGSDYILNTGAGRFVTGAIMEPAGTTFDPPLLICMAWQDANNNGNVDNLDFVVNEVNIRPTLRDETTGTELVLGPPCGLQAACGLPVTGGLPATVPGTLDNPALAACCSTQANLYCFEVTHFSAYAIADLSCAGTATARIIATGMDKPTGEQGLKVKGEFDLGGPIAGGLDPTLSGFELVLLSASGTPLYQVTLPSGAYSREAGEGWKPSARGGKTQWKSKTGIAGVDKVKLEWNDATGRGSFDLKGKDLALAVTPDDLPLQVEVRLDPSALTGRCGTATFTSPGDVCAFNGSASTLLCQ